MRRIAGMLALLLCLLTPLWALGETAQADAAGQDADTVLTIQENIFVYQLQQMEKNPEQYAGKSVEIEGLFGTFHYGEADDLHTYYMVYRYYPGDCCSVDAIGLEAYLPDASQPYPADGDWVRAKGTLETYTLDGYTYLQIRLTSLETLPQEGETFVLE